MDLFSSFKENFKTLLFNSLITGLRLENRLTYQVVHCHHDADFEEYFLTYHKVLNQIILVPTYRGISQYILRSGSLRNSLSSSMLKNKRNVSLVFLKLVYICFLSMTLQLGVSNNDIK